MTIPKPFMLAPLVFFQLYLLGTVVLFAFGPWNWFVPNASTLYAFLLGSQVAILLGYLAGTRTPELARSNGTLGRTGRLWFRTSIVMNVLLALPTSYARTGAILPDVVSGILDPGTSYIANIARLSEGGPFVVIEYVRILTAPIILSLFPLTVLYWRSLGAYEKGAASLLILFNLAMYLSVGQNKGLADLLATLAFLTVAGGLAHRVAIRSTLATSIAIVGVGLVGFFAYFGMTQLLRQGGAVTGQRGSFGWSTSTPGSFDPAPEAQPSAPLQPAAPVDASAADGTGAPAVSPPPQSELTATPSTSAPPATPAPLPGDAPAVAGNEPTGPAVPPEGLASAEETSTASTPPASETSPMPVDAPAPAPAAETQSAPSADATPAVADRGSASAPPSPTSDGMASGEAVPASGPAPDLSAELPGAAAVIDPMPAVPADISFGGPGAVTAAPDHIVAQFAPDFVRTVYESFARYLGQGYQALTLTFDLDHSLTWGFGNSMFFARNADRVLGTDYFVSNSLPAVLETETGWSMFHLWHSIYPWIASDVGFVGTLAVMALIGWLLAVAWIRSIRDLDPMWGTLLYLLLLLFFYIPANNQLMQSGETAFGFTALLALVAGRSLLRRVGARRSADTFVPSG